MINTMEKSEYIGEHLVYSFIVFLACKGIIFRCLSNCTYYESLFVLLLIGAVVMGFGILLTWNRGRNYLNLTLHIILTWGVFAVIAYTDIFMQRMLTIGLCAAVISMVMTILVLARKIKRTGNRRFVIRKRVWKVFYLWKRNFAVASLLLLVPIAVSMLLHGTVLNAKLDVKKVHGDEHSLDANLDVICGIDPQRWDKLDVQQRLNVCQTIVNCEARYLGISHEIAVGTGALKETMLAYYSEAQHQIVINLELLNSSYSYDVLEALIHEVTHAYQYEQVALYQKLDATTRNLLMFRNVSVYMDEFANYQDGSEDFGLYYSQLSEINARRAAEEESKEYIERVNYYLYGQSDEQ